MFPNLRFSLRILIKHPGFTVVALLSLALGIGVNSVIFSLVDGAMLRPLPFSDVGRVVRVFAADDRNPRQTFSYPVYQRLREDSRAFSGLTAVEGAGGLLRGEDRSEMLTTEQVSPDYFGVLGVRPLLGRAFDETGALSEPVAVISHSLWQRRFGGDRQVVGTSIVFQERLFTIVGVAPEGFGGTQRVMMADVWYPVEATADRAATMSEERRPFGLIGRLSPGVSVEQAQVEMDTLARRLDLVSPTSSQPQRITLVRETDYTGIGDAGDNKALAYLLLLMVMLVLIVACNNVSSLLLARSEARRQEVATRLALGSTRGQLVAQFLQESLVLASLAAGGCLLLVFWAQAALSTLLPTLPIPLDLGLRLDVRVVAYTFFLALLAVVLFGLGPALRATRVDLTPLLNGDASARHSARRRHLGRRALLVGQLTISFVFLALAGAFMHSVRQGLSADFGFEQRNL